MAEDLLPAFDSHQINLIGYNQGGHGLLFRADQEAVEHTQVRGRVGTGEDENNLIRIGDDNLLVFTLRGRSQAGDHALAGLNTIDRAAPAFRWSGQHPVTDGCQVAFPAAFF